MSGNDKLPIAEFRGIIVDTVRNNPVTIVTAETGAGKSTQVPQYLLDEGMRIAVTQPRRLAARTVAERVAFEMGTRFGDVVGFRTAFERCDSPNTRCLFVTDGLALVREISQSGTCDCLVLDETHEWNVHMEVLVAWAKVQVTKNPSFRVVIMSATIETEKLSEFFGNAPVISVPGRTYPVEVQDRGMSMVSDISRLAQQGRNVLVFLPGKAEIVKTMADLKNDPALNAETLSLHGELTPEEQARAFAGYNRPKIVLSTNVAQTSVTIDDIDAVVDSGKERRIELVAGVETLTLASISRADSMQRKGRAGRTKPGIYIDYDESVDRPDFPVPEIMRVRLDQTVLRLAEHNFDMEQVEFFHQPPVGEIHEAKRVLHALGCMNEDGSVTRIGHRIAKLPVSCASGRMILEADRLGVMDDILSVAAILEQGGINARVCNSCRERQVKKCSCWRHNLAPDVEDSDILAQLAAFNKCRDMTKDEIVKSGIYLKAFFAVVQIRKKIVSVIKGHVRFGTSGNGEMIKRAVCAGMVDHLYKKSWGKFYINGDEEPRMLDHMSVLMNRTPQWLVGKPFNIDPNGWGEPMRLINMATEVDPKWLAEVAPQLVKDEVVNTRYDPDNDSVLVLHETTFSGQVIDQEWRRDDNHPALSDMRRQHKEYRATMTEAQKKLERVDRRRRVEDEITRMWLSFDRTHPEPTEVFKDVDAIVTTKVVTIGNHPETGKPIRAFGTWEYRGMYLGQPDIFFTWTLNPIDFKNCADHTAEHIEEIVEGFRSYKRQQRRQAQKSFSSKPRTKPLKGGI